MRALATLRPTRSLLTALDEAVMAAVSTQRRLRKAAEEGDACVEALARIRDCVKEHLAQKGEETS